MSRLYRLSSKVQNSRSCNEFLSDLAFVIRFAVNDVIRWVLENLFVLLFGICASLTFFAGA